MKEIFEVFWLALRLGLTAFGGPVAHIGFFREEYVARRKWLEEERFAELMAVTQFLPGPGSSQLGAAVGYERAGWLGGLAAWIGFTMPSAMVMILFAIGIGVLEPEQLFWIKGLVLAALGVVLNAVMGMHEQLCNNLKTNFIAVISFMLLFFFYTAWMQPIVILLGGILGLFLCKVDLGQAVGNKGNLRKIWVALAILATLIAVPILLKGSADLDATGGIFKSGSLVFGGGHVVLPMLADAVVEPGYMDRLEFTAGYGMTQAMPGPVFTFGAYLGAKLELFGNPWLGGLVGLIAVFLPGMLLLIACVPIWDSLKEKAWARSAMKGANAAVVGLLAAAVLKLLVAGDLAHWWEWLVVVACFAILRSKLLPAWTLVLGMAGLGLLIY